MIDPRVPFDKRKAERKTQGCAREEGSDLGECMRRIMLRVGREPTYESDMSFRERWFCMASQRLRNLT
jgi:hypothetical protein